MVHYFPLGYNVTWRERDMETCCKLHTTFTITGAGASQVGVTCNDWRVSNGLHVQFQQFDDWLSHQSLQHAPSVYTHATGCNTDRYNSSVLYTLHAIGVTSGRNTGVDTNQPVYTQL